MLVFEKEKNKSRFWLERLSRNKIQYLWIIHKMAYRNLYAPSKMHGNAADCG